MNIAILDDYQNVVKDLDCFNLLDGHEVRIFNETYTDEALLSSHLDGVEALVLIRERTKITESLLDRLPDLKVISQTGKVSNHISIEQCNTRGITVLEGTGSPVAPAELCWALIMSASRNLVPYISNFSQHSWQDSGALGLGRKLAGLTLGIWGYGKIGQRIARYGAAFDMNILVWGSESSRELASSQGFQAAESRKTLFEQADIVSLHLRLNDQTRYSVTRKDLASMREDSLFVNTSRAELVEADALVNEMRENPRKRAAVDVYEIEPASSETTALLSLENVLCSPHIGYVEKSSYELYFSTALENLINYIKQR